MGKLAAQCPRCDSYNTKSYNSRAAHSTANKECRDCGNVFSGSGGWA